MTARGETRAPTFRRWLRGQRDRDDLDDLAGELVRLDASDDVVPWYVPEPIALIEYLATHTALTDAQATEMGSAAGSAYLKATDSVREPPRGNRS